MPDRGIELRQLGALALELAEQGRVADVVLVDECLYAGTFDVPAPPHILKRLRELWETSKTSKRTWESAVRAEEASPAMDGASEIIARVASAGSKAKTAVH